MLVQSAKTQIVKLVHFTICSAGTAGAAPNETGCGSLLGNLASKAQKPRQARARRVRPGPGREPEGAGGIRREPEGAGGSQREPERAGGTRREPEGAGGSRREAGGSRRKPE